MTELEGRKKQFLINKWFQGNDELLLFIIICITGIISSSLGYRLLDGYKYNFGKNLAGVFVPPFLCLFYLTYTGFQYGLKSSILVKALFLYFLQIAPYVPLFLQVFQPTGGDDFSRYYLYAKNMVDNNTLWGGDKLFFKESGYHYVTQPGYRYFIYLELLLFGGLYRFVTFVNIGFYVVTVYFFHKAIHQVINEKKLKLCLLVLTLLFSIYVVKNLLMGLPEWLTVCFLMWVCYFYIVPKQRVNAVFILGLVPFFRQNLLFAILLLFVWMLKNNRNKAAMYILFLLPLLLPLYHNLYYAGEWRFFVDIFQLPFLIYNDKGHGSAGLNYSLILSNIAHYIGLDLENGRISVSFVAMLFLPFATVMYFFLIKMIPTMRYKILFILISMSAIVPVIFLGSAYYPRFELVNVVITLVTFLLLYVHVSACPIYTTITNTRLRQLT